MDRNAAAGTRQVVASAVVTLSNAKQNRPLLALLGLTAISLAGLLLVPPIPQDQSYHQFADQRILLGIPNFGTSFQIFPSSRSARWDCHNFIAIQPSYSFLEYF